MADVARGEHRSQEWNDTVPLVFFPRLGKRVIAASTMSGLNFVKRLGRPCRAAAERLTDKVLESATKLFAERGYEATSIAAIAAEAQVGKHTIYRRYPDKAALFHACVEHMADHIIEARGDSAEADGQPLAALRALVTRTAVAATDPQMIALYRMTISEAARFPELATIFGDLENDRLLQRAAALIASAQAAGSVRSDEDPEFLGGLLLEMSAGFVTHQGLAGIAMSPEAIADHVERSWRVYLQGAAPRE